MISLNEDSFRLFRSDHSLPRYFSVKEEAVLVRYFDVKLVIRNVGKIENTYYLLNSQLHVTLSLGWKD